MLLAFISFIWIKFKIKRIEDRTLSFSSLQLIMIPQNVQFINDSAFHSASLNLILIEAGNDIVHDEYEFLIDARHHQLILNFSV
jgi:hypothetical protein